MKNLLKKHLFTYRGYLPAIDRIAFEREIHYHTMRKITILGSPGTGKTTLARILGQKRDLTVMHLDQTYWQKDWQAMPPKPFNDAVRTFITSHSRYVVDGNYTNHRSFDERIGLSDTIILLDYPQKTALKGIIKREAQYKNRARSDMASGCLEGLDQEFLQYTAFFSTKKQQLQGFLNTIKHKKRVLVFPSRDALELWLANL